MITSLSFFMSVFWSCMVILAVHLLRKKQFFLNGFGISTIIQLYVFCVCRMLVVLEFPFTRVIELPELYNTFFRVVCVSLHRVGNYEFTIFDCFLVVWLLAASVMTALYLVGYVRGVLVIRRMSHTVDEQAEEILREIQMRYGSRIRIRTVRCAATELPIGVGLFRKQILLPPGKYTDSELRYILMHEYMHFRNHDLPAKILIELFTCLYWWNPLVYLLKADVEQMLELKCDLHVTSGLDDLERAAYLRAIASCLKRSGEQEKTRLSRVSTQFFRLNGPGAELIERFKLVAYPVSRNSRKFQVASIICFSVLLICSYLFIIQPRFKMETPEDTVGVAYMDDIRLSGSIVKHWDGRYTLYNEDGQLIPLNEETALELAEKGFDIIER